EQVRAADPGHTGAKKGLARSDRGLGRLDHRDAARGVDPHGLHAVDYRSDLDRLPRAMAAAHLENVSDTARCVALSRALESELLDAHLRDPYARRVAGERGEE